jgi:Subtilase family/Fervidolysin N-terminal prodomain
MRSSSTKSKPSVKESKSHLPLALSTIVAVLTLVSAAEAAQRIGPSGSFGGHAAGAFGSKVIGGGGRITGVPIGLPGSPGGKPGKGGTTTGDGGRPSGGAGGNDRPHKPRFPKHPIIVGIPTGVTAVTATVSSVSASGGGRPPSRALVLARTGSGVPPANERRYRPDEVLTQFTPGVSNQTLDALGRRLRLDRIASFISNGATISRWKIPDQRTVPTVVRALEAERIVLAAQPNYLYELQEQPAPSNEPGPALVGEGDPGQYALAKLRLREAHQLVKGEKVLIAVIDSGVDPAHPELAGMIADSFDALESDEKPHAHGTAVAGAIVAHARLMGVAPQARILVARAFSAQERTPAATTYSVIQSIDWALARGARIINMSFTGPRDPSIERRVAQARQQGVVLIAAAGNGGPKSRPLYPAAYADVIAVTATDADDKLFQGANRGTHIALAAPGVDVLLPAPDATYQVATGTSFAAAEVSGIAALLLERQPDLRPAGVREALIATARDLGPKGIDPQFGAGLVDAYQAILSVKPAAIGTAAGIVPPASE